MSEKFLCLIAEFDEETSKSMGEIYQNITKLGITGGQTADVPYHITLSYFDTKYEKEILQRLYEVCSGTKSFNLSFSHIGLFGLKVLFLAPDVNSELLGLHKALEVNSIKSTEGWTAHATILIDEPENIQKALPVVAENFNKLSGKIESVSLYEFFPTRFIARYRLL